MSEAPPPRIEAFFNRVDKPGMAARRRPVSPLREPRSPAEETTVMPSQTVEYAVLTEAPERVRRYARAAAQRKLREKENRPPPPRFLANGSAEADMPASTPASPDSLVDVWRRCSRKRPRTAPPTPLVNHLPSPEKKETLLQSLVKLRASLKKATATANEKSSKPARPLTSSSNRSNPVEASTRPSPRPTPTPTRPAPSTGAVTPIPVTTDKHASSTALPEKRHDSVAPLSELPAASIEDEDDFYAASGTFLSSQDLLDLDIP